jgi:hypothetical protein
MLWRLTVLWTLSPDMEVDRVGDTVESRTRKRKPRTEAQREVRKKRFKARNEAHREADKKQRYEFRKKRRRLAAGGDQFAIAAFDREIQQQRKRRLDPETLRLIEENSFETE